VARVCHGRLRLYRGAVKLSRPANSIRCYGNPHNTSTAVEKIRGQSKLAQCRDCRYSFWARQFPDRISPRNPVCSY
jgi:hypothetical protein